jgi:hypothetical protein
MVARAAAAPGQALSCDPEAHEYFAALLADEERVSALRRALTEADPSVAVNEAMERAFGANLRTAEDSPSGIGMLRRIAGIRICGAFLRRWHVSRRGGFLCISSTPLALDRVITAAS